MGGDTNSSAALPTRVKGDCNKTAKPKASCQSQNGNSALKAKHLPRTPDSVSIHHGKVNRQAQVQQIALPEILPCPSHL